MKNFVKNAIFGALLLVSFALIISEPVADTWYDSIVGFILVKVAAVTIFGVSLYKLGYIEEANNDEEEKENTNN